MANVYVFGPETLTQPGPSAVDPNTLRFFKVLQFLEWELLALFNARYLTAIAYDPSMALAKFFNGSWRSVIPVSPNAIQHPNPTVSAVPIANVPGSFAPDMVISLGGGISPDATQQAAIFALRGAAVFTASITGSVMTVSAVASGTIAIGATISGPGILPNTTIVDQSAGTAGGAGTYDLSQPQFGVPTAVKGGLFNPVVNATLITLRTDILWRDASNIG